MRYARAMFVRAAMNALPAADASVDPAERTGYLRSGVPPALTDSPAVIS
jgi:hypothetical protein